MGTTPDVLSQSVPEVTQADKTDEPQAELCLDEVPVHEPVFNMQHFGCLQILFCRKTYGTNIHSVPTEKAKLRRKTIKGETFARARSVLLMILIFPLVVKGWLLKCIFLW